MLSVYGDSYRAGDRSLSNGDGTGTFPRYCHVASPCFKLQLVEQWPLCVQWNPDFKMQVARFWSLVIRFKQSTASQLDSTKLLTNQPKSTQPNPTQPNPTQPALDGTAEISQTTGSIDDLYAGRLVCYIWNGYSLDGWSHVDCSRSTSQTIMSTGAIWTAIAGTVIAGNSWSLCMRQYHYGLWDIPRRSGKLKHLNKFDASFFGFHSRRAHQTDPQLRILLDVGQTYALVPAPCGILKFWRIGALSEDDKSRDFDADGKGFDRSEVVTAIYIERELITKRHELGRIEEVVSK
uniref:Beta-ketoacyl synthase-like N-terminal domain-containing protein n=1 Tax=Strigamia maritima TaxID=126957 RepID=T1IXX3_STRMM